MTVVEVVKAMNSNDTRIKAKRLMYLRGYYLSMYRVHMVRLFDDCFISDPTVFNEKELFRNIADMNIVDMFDNFGILRLTYNQALFAYFKSGESSKRFLYNLMNALKYRELGLCIDKIYEDCGFRENLVNRVPLYMCMQGSLIIAKSGIEFTRAMAESLCEFEDEVHTIDINEILWGFAMKELGIPKDEWQDDGLFDGKLTHSEEVICAKGILNGFFKVTGGKYSELLLKWLKAHPWGKNRMSFDSKGLYDSLFLKYESELNYAVDALTSAIVRDKDSTLLGAYGSVIYYKCNRTVIHQPIGIFQVINTMDIDEQIMPQCACINGLTGEFYALDRLEEDGIGYAGCPVVIEFGDECIIAYDREQTDVQFESWFSYNGASFVFDEKECAKMPSSKFAPYSDADTLYRGYLEALKSSDNLIVPLNMVSSGQYEHVRKDVWDFIGKCSA